MRLRWLVLVLWLLWGGIAAARPAASGGPVPPATAAVSVPVSAGRAPRVPEPTYRWHGLTVPVGACGAVVGGRTMVLPCGDRRVVAYRSERATLRRRLVDAVGGGLAVAGLASCVALGRRGRTRRGVGSCADGGS